MPNGNRPDFEVRAGSRNPLIFTIGYYATAADRASGTLTAVNLTSAAVVMKVLDNNTGTWDSLTAGGGNPLVITTAASGIVTWTPAASYLKGDKRDYYLYFEVTPSGGTVADYDVVTDFWIRVSGRRAG